MIDAAEDFGGGRVIGRDISENGNEDEPSSRRGRRGRSRLEPFGLVDNSGVDIVV